MSDARQAIAVAKQAGAADLATADFKAAEEYLQSAERRLNASDFPQARRDALQAKSKALSALKQAETAKDENVD